LLQLELKRRRTHPGFDVFWEQAMIGGNNSGEQ
jgi:hypothetical protein